VVRKPAAPAAGIQADAQNCRTRQTRADPAPRFAGHSKDKTRFQPVVHFHIGFLFWTELGLQYLSVDGPLRIGTADLFSSRVSIRKLMRLPKKVTKGKVVIIHFGPFAGLSGLVVSTSPDRTVVRVILKGRSTLVELDTNMIRESGRDGLRRPAGLRPGSRPN